MFVPHKNSFCNRLPNTLRVTIFHVGKKPVIYSFSYSLVSGNFLAVDYHRKFLFHKQFSCQIFCIQKSKEHHLNERCNIQLN